MTITRRGLMLGAAMHLPAVTVLGPVMWPREPHIVVVPRSPGPAPVRWHGRELDGLWLDEAHTLASLEKLFPIRIDWAEVSDWGGRLAEAGEVQ